MFSDNMANQQETLIKSADFGKYRPKGMPEGVTLKDVRLDFFIRKEVTDLSGKSVGRIADLQIDQDIGKVNGVLIEEIKPSKRG